MNTSATLLTLALAAGAAFAGPKQITIHGGDAGRVNAVVTFAAPREWEKEYLLATRDGATKIPLQVDDQGRASLIVPRLGKGERLVLAPVKFEAVAGLGVSVAKAGSVLRFTANGRQPVFDYQMEAGEVPEGVLPIFKHGAHLHPVYSPSGKLVTGDHPADHRWHRGIWMAWTDTEFEGRHPDFWNQGKGEGPDKSGAKLLAEVRFDSLVQSWGGPVHGGFVSKHRFVDHSSGVAKDVLHETWEVTAYPVAGAFVIDFVSTQTCAGTSPLKLPKYHYGGLGVRGNQLWNPVDAVKMLTSNGDDRVKGDATKGKWVHLGGDVDGAPAGLAVLIHPGNFRFPQPLRLNPKNPQLCIAPSQDGDWSIEPGQPYVSRYRFIVSDGAAEGTALDAWWSDYAQPLQVTVE